ncbi:MAG: apolipoprotein N-acyltransferase [Methylophilaceae bacterium]
MNHPTLKPLVLFLLGALAVFGFAPYYLFPVSIISLAGLFYFLEKSNTPKTAFWSGFQYGLGLFVFGIYWIYISLHDFGGMPWWFAGFATLCLCAFMALFIGLVGWLSKKLGYTILSVPVLWGLSDWTRSWIFTGFPWLTMGYSQVPHSPLAGFMPIIGVYGVSVLTVLLAALLGLCFIRSKDRLLVRNAIAGITLLLVSGGLLKAIEWTQTVGKPVSVALIQGNIAQDLKWSPDIAQSTIDQYLSMIKASNAQLIVLPETALPIIYTALTPDEKATIVAQAKRNQGDIIIGMIEQEAPKNDTEAGDYYNSALSFNETGVQTYRKNHLVPFGEFIPLKQIFGWIYRDFLNMPLSDISRGGKFQAPIQIANQHKIGMNVCYEDVFGEEIIRQLPQATLLVNISNDAWYGNSFAADQHMQFSQARALETGRVMLRATNTGATAAIDQHGEVFGQVPHFSQTTLNTSAQNFTGSTPYVRWGNWPFIIFSFGAIFAIILKKKVWLKSSR